MIRGAIAELIRPQPPPLEDLANRLRNQIARNEKSREDRWRAKKLIAPKKRVV